MKNIKLGRILGFPIELRASFLILLGFVTLSGLLRGHPLLSLSLLLATFIGVLLHELGHAVVARRLGVPIVGIDLHVFGGAAKMAGMPKSARDEILIAAAGPAVSLVLAGVGWLLFALTGFVGFFYLLWTNLLLGLFNLLPALPMGGGRIFRAALSSRLGHLRATVLAVKVAKGVSVGLGLLGLVFANFWLVALAVMLWVMAGQELAQARFFGGYGTPSGGFGFASSGGFGGPGGFASNAASVEVLDRDGRPLNTRSVHAQGIALSVEETIEGGVRRWIVRDGAGRVLLRSEHPLY